MTGAGNNQVAWFLSGDDSGDFSISDTGALTFEESPDYEAPADADTNNVYHVIVEAVVGGDTVTLDVTVTVTNLEEAPEFPGGRDHHPQRGGEHPGGPKHRRPGVGCG